MHFHRHRAGTGLSRSIRCFIGHRVAYINVERKTASVVDETPIGIQAANSILVSLPRVQTGQRWCVRFIELSNINHDRVTVLAFNLDIEGCDDRAKIVGLNRNRDGKRIICHTRIRNGSEKNPVRLPLPPQYLFTGLHTCRGEPRKSDGHLTNPGDKEHVTPQE